MLLSMTRGSYHGEPINAKPLYIIAIFKGIEDGNILGNKLPFSPSLEHLYVYTCKEYEPNKIPTPFYKPFFHSKSEPFYFIKWKGGKAIDKACRTPSAKYLRENVEYAVLDDQLWDMLQDANIREELKQSIIKYFLR